MDGDGDALAVGRPRSSQVHVPAHFLHGELDTEVPLSVSRECSDVAPAHGCCALLADMASRPIIRALLSAKLAEHLDRVGWPPTAIILGRRGPCS
jgi:hypothetical protein